MTQTPRDWKKDMELAHKARYEFSIIHLNNVLDSLFYWLQEAKVYKQSYDATLTAYEAKKARADISEAREQRLKEAAVKVKEIYESDIHDEEALNIINDMFKELLSTLYPDTPAPTTKED